MCKKSREDNIKRNTLVLHLVNYLSKIYKEDLELQESGEVTLISKISPKNLRRIPTSFASYSALYFNLTFTRKIISTLNFLYKNPTEAKYHLNYIVNFESKYDLDASNFLKHIKNNNQSDKKQKVKKNKKSKKKIVKKKLQEMKN